MHVIGMSYIYKDKEITQEERISLLRLEEFEEAIAANDIPVIVKLLRDPLLIKNHETMLKLADHLDPNGPSNKFSKKTGNKPTSQGKAIAIRNIEVAAQYYYLCNNLEFARYLFNRQKKEFEVEREPILNDDGEIIPVWKYPNLNYYRNKKSIPTHGVIRDYLCTKYEIGKTTFEKISAESNKQGWPLLFQHNLLGIVFPQIKLEYLQEAVATTVL